MASTSTTTPPPPPTTTSGESPSAALANRTREIWELNAPFWDERMGDGDDFQRDLAVPAVEGLLGVEEGSVILDVACGNGAFARRLADQGAEVVACDFAETFITLARGRDSERSSARRHPIDYRVVDATDERALLGLGEDRFDAILCNMALMDMIDIEPLFWAVPRLLHEHGRFVFTIMHPAFNHQAAHFVAEETRTDTGRTTDYSLKVTNYLAVPPTRGESMSGLPEPSYTFHRPLSEILNAAFNAGLLMDGIAEPAFPAGSGSMKSGSWMNYPTIPPILAARFRKALR
ncbi:MAG: class I SAM-dependent methyltransferase [Thermomicrobiales bacterium]